MDITAKGGIYLLNVGPNSEGLSPVSSIKRLEIMGQWLEVNGEAIYATQKLNKVFKQCENIRFTKKKNKSKTRRKRGSGGASCKKTKDCSDGKKCLPGGTQNLEGVDGECVSKSDYISTMKERGQEKRDERAVEKKEREQNQQEVDLSSLPQETNEDKEIKKSD